RLLPSGLELPGVASEVGVSLAKSPPQLDDGLAELGLALLRDRGPHPALAGGLIQTRNQTRHPVDLGGGPEPRGIAERTAVVRGPHHGHARDRGEDPRRGVRSTSSSSRSAAVIDSSNEPSSVTSAASTRS